MKARAGSFALELWLPALVLVGWFLVSAGSTSLFFPPLSDILDRFSDLLAPDRAAEVILPSLGRLAAGFSLAAMAGIGLGVALALSPKVRAVLDPIVHFLRALPPPALLPFAIVAFGIGAQMKIWIIAFGALFPIMLNTIDGLRSVDPVARETARAYRLPGPMMLRAVLLPAAMPQVFAGLRVGLQVSLLLMVVSEMVASTGGIGHFILQSQQNFAVPEMWAGILLLGLLGYLLNWLFVITERRTLRWYLATRGDVTR